MALNNVLNIIKYKNRDLVLAYLRKHYNKNSPVYYEDIQRELDFSIDYLCQLLRPLKKHKLIYVKSIGCSKAQGPRKEIHLTEFGKWVVDYISNLWLTKDESSWLLLERNFKQEIEKSPENILGFTGSLIVSSKKDICQIISNHISSFITPNILSKVLINDIASDILEDLLKKMNSIKDLRLKRERQVAMS